jgi:hypothetical protein
VRSACLYAIVAAACPIVASAQGLAISPDPGSALHGEWPKELRLLPGAISLKASLAAARYLEVSIGAGFVGLPNLSDSIPPMSGMAATFGVGLRLKRPRDRRALGSFSPWVDIEALSVQGGSGGHPALAVGAGFFLPIGGRERGIWVGPFVRYFQVMEPSGAHLDWRVPGVLFAGVTLEIDFSAGPAR